MPVAVVPGVGICLASDRHRQLRQFSFAVKNSPTVVAVLWINACKRLDVKMDDIDMDTPIGISCDPLNVSLYLTSFLFSSPSRLLRLLFRYKPTSSNIKVDGM